MDMLLSIGEQSRESTEWVRKKKKKATVGRICRKKGSKTGMKEWGVMDDEWWVSEQFQKRPECIQFYHPTHRRSSGLAKFVNIDNGSSKATMCCVISKLFIIHL